MTLPSLSNEYLDKVLVSLTSNKVPHNLIESIRYSLLAPGKRIRPRLSIATSRMIGLDDLPAHAIAVSLEMLHCFTLIHDDLPCMDNDDFRRGKPSNHKAFGENVALLAGDALFALSVEALITGSKKSVNPEALIEGTELLLEALGPRGVTGGQSRELLLKEASSIDSIKLVHEQKTAALFVAVFEIPRALKGITKDSKESKIFVNLGTALGWAFQVADDLEDDISKHTEIPAWNVLKFMNRDDAIKNAENSLVNALIPLKNKWKIKADDIAAICEEVIKRLISLKK